MNKGKKFIVKKLKKKRCKSCQKEFQPNVPLQQVCDYKCAMELVKKVNDAKILKEQKEENKAWNKRKKEIKEKLKTLSDWKYDLEVEINSIVRLIDKGHECISSNNKKYVVNAGHYYSVGSFPALRYNLLNIFNQSVHDNKFRGGNELAYGKGLQDKFGQDIFEEIQALRGKYPVLDISIPEIKEVLPVVRKIVRELKKQTEDLEKPFTIEERIEIRKKLNQRIGIYK